VAKTLMGLPGDTKGIVPMGEAIEAIRTGFREWGQDPEINAPRRRIHVPTGVRVSVHQGGSFRRGRYWTHDSLRVGETDGGASGIP